MACCLVNRITYCLTKGRLLSRREQFLKDYEKSPDKVKGLTKSTLKIDRAKTFAQLNRNNALRKVSDLLKKEKADSVVDIVWKKTGSKNREVTIDGYPAFCRTPEDSSGSFFPPFTHLQL